VQASFKDRTSSEDPSLEEAIFDLTRNETGYHAGPLAGPAKGS
jgi:hypothetical protein